MGLFGKTDKRIIADLSKKSENIDKDMNKEINDLFEELKSDYDENHLVINEFSDFVNELKVKLSKEDASKLLEFSTRITKVKRCASKGVEAMRELARNQKKASMETQRGYQEYLYV